MPCLTKCCFCINLRIGGIIIGIVTAILALFSLIPSALSLGYCINLAQIVTHLIEKYNEDNQNSKRYLIFWGTVTSFLSNEKFSLPSQDQESVIWLGGVMYIFFIICIILLIGYFICSILLLIGTMKGKRWLMIPWIIATFLIIIGYFSGIILSAWIFGFSFEVIFLLLFSFIEVSIILYIWLCVISAFQILENGDVANYNWELKPRFTTKYDGVPTIEH